MTTSKKNWIIYGLLAIALVFTAAFCLTAKNIAPNKAFAYNGLEIVSAGGNPVKAEPEDGEFEWGKLPYGHINQPYSAFLEATGGCGEYLWTIDQTALPQGLTLNENTGEISGTPTGTVLGSTITFRATDADDEELCDVANIGLTIIGDDWEPVITTDTTGYGVAGSDFYMEINCETAINSSIDYSVVSGNLPDGLELSKFGQWTGNVSGTPTTVGTYTFSIKADNGFGYDVKEYTVIIDEQLTVSSEEIPYYGYYYLGDTVQFTASIGNENVNWQVVNAESENTTISESGLLTIGLDETKYFSILIYATSKTNPNNYNGNSVQYKQSIPHSVTAIDGIAENIGGYSITRAGEGETVYFDTYDINGKEFVCWTVEAGSTPVEIFNANEQRNAYITMPQGDVIVRANFATIITEVSASFDTPVNGNHVDTTIETGSPNYTATLSEVYTRDNFSEGTAENLDDLVFETGVEYVFCIEFTAQPGYVLADHYNMSVTINGQELYTFSAWHGGNVYTKYIVALSDELTLYNVTVNGGLASHSQAQANAQITISATVPEGYVFDKWSTTDGVTFADDTAQQTTFTMPEKNVTVTATFKQVEKVTISFNANGGGGVISNVQLNKGSTYTLPDCTFSIPTGKVFKCWSVNGVNKNEQDVITVNADTTVTAVWETIIVRVMVYFNANEGSGEMDTLWFDKGETYTLPQCTFIPPQGYVFKCWKLNGAEREVGYVTTLNDTITITAVWIDPNAATSASASNSAVVNKVTKKHNKGIGAGAIAAIVVVILIVVSVGGFAIYWFLIAHKNWQQLVDETKKLYNDLFKSDNKGVTTTTSETGDESVTVESKIDSADNALNTTDNAGTAKKQTKKQAKSAKEVHEDKAPEVTEEKNDSLNADQDQSENIDEKDGNKDDE